VLAAQIHTPEYLAERELDDIKERRNRILLHERVVPIPTNTPRNLISTTPHELKDDYIFLASPGDMISIDSIFSDEERLNR
jgi:hypothetical protein